MNQDGGKKCEIGLPWHGLRSTGPRRVIKQTGGGRFVVQWSKHRLASWMEGQTLKTCHTRRSSFWTFVALLSMPVRNRLLILDSMVV